jgi:aspartate/tyrosine/aromatic aminotransferase
MHRYIHTYIYLYLYSYIYTYIYSGDSEEDAYSIRKFVADGNHIILSQSYAKNFGLYGERVGALSVVTANEDETTKVLLQQFVERTRVCLFYIQFISSVLDM